MKLDFTPSEKLLKKAKDIYTLHEAGLTYYEIAERYKNHRVTVTKWGNLWKQRLEEKEKNEK